MSSRGAPGGAITIVYCIIPAELAEVLLEPLREHFRDDRAVEVVVERRGSERRGRERRAADKGPPGEERRRIRSPEGRRVADRRAPVAGTEAPELPGLARPHADRLRFARRVEPTGQPERDLEDARLVRRLQGGDREALTNVYLRHFDTIYTYSRAALRDHHEAEDVTQQVFIKVMGSIDSYEVRGGIPFRAWLLRVTRNTVVDVARRRRRLVIEEPERVGERTEAEVGLPSGVLEWLSDKDVAMFVERLPEPQRDVLVCRYVLNLTVNEVAGVLERTPESVRQLQSRALRTLKRRLAAIGHGSSRSSRSFTRSRIARAPVLRARRLALAGPLVRPLARR